MKHDLASAFVGHDGWRGGGAWRVAVLLFAACLVSETGCSPSSSSSAPPSRCDPSRCSAGSDCIDDGSDAGARCLKVCTKQSDCPFNWYCNDSQPKSGCVESTIPVPPVDGGQWGALCPPACDTIDTFDCYGLSPTDPNAFCTFYDCAQDSDCKGGWWCATVEGAPNLTTADRTFGQPPRNACLPRGYCASCKLDHDCPATAGGQPQQCIPDAKGNGFCTTQCGTDTNCPLDATCRRVPWGRCTQATCATDGDCVGYAVTEKCFAGACRAACKRDADCPKSNGAPQHCDATGACTPQACTTNDDCPPAGGVFQDCSAGICTPECSVDTDCNATVRDQTCAPAQLTVCMPRAGVCRGDGTYCSPCRVDADCPSGYCIDAPYSTERFCSQTMANGATCGMTGPPPGSCPTPPSGANYKTACTSFADAGPPANQCVGVVTLGKLPTGQPAYELGCWTVNR